MASGYLVSPLSRSIINLTSNSFCRGISLGNQQGQDHQPVIIGAGLFEQVVLFQEQQEEKGANCPDSSPRTWRSPLSALMDFSV
jgi:hypothetical protein